MKKRRLTLTAGILGTVSFSICVLGIVVLLANLSATSALTSSDFNNVFFLTTLTDIFRSLGAASTITLVTALISILFAVVALVLNACSLNAYSAGADKYRRKRGLLISTIIFNVIEIGFTVYGFVAPLVAKPKAELPVATLIVAAIFVAAIVLSTVFYIVDLCLERKR